ncbi:MAG: DoxX family protein [Pseudomonadota bacterium]
MLRSTRLALTALLSLAFLYYGLRKLTGDPRDVMLYAELGFGQWIRFVTGSVETFGALALWPALTARWAALVLTGTMVTGLSAITTFTSLPFAHLVLLLIATLVLSALHWVPRLR